MFSKDLEDTYSPGRHYRQCHNALIYSKYKAKSLEYEIYILVTHRYYVKLKQSPNVWYLSTKCKTVSGLWKICLTYLHLV